MKMEATLLRKETRDILPTATDNTTLDEEVLIVCWYLDSPDLFGKLNNKQVGLSTVTPRNTTAKKT